MVAAAPPVDRVGWLLVGRSGRSGVPGDDRRPACARSSQGCRNARAHKLRMGSHAAFEARRVLTGGLRAARGWPIATTSVVLISRSLREWRNWQTRTVQVRVPVRAWGFKSPLAHQSHTGSDQAFPARSRFRCRPRENGCATASERVARGPGLCQPSARGAVTLSHLCGGHVRCEETSNRSYSGGRRVLDGSSERSSPHDRAGLDVGSHIHPERAGGKDGTGRPPRVVRPYEGSSTPGHQQGHYPSESPGHGV